MFTDVVCIVLVRDSIPRDYMLAAIFRGLRLLEP